jgi:hypothetical protein
MALKITLPKDRSSEKAWGDVDKSAIWNRLKEALQNDEAGAKEAVKEMYAVVKATINADLTQADCWGPHHEIIDDTLILNRSGLFAAAQALAGARAEPDLTMEQKRSAAKHLLRHYRELDLLAPESVRVLAGEKPIEGEMVSLKATVAGEMSVEEVPVSAAIDVQALKEGDNEPLEVVVEIPAGRSKRGWLYTPQALKRIVDVVMEQGLPGFLGHQKPEDVDHQFPQPVTHWVGGKIVGDKAYIRGVVDTAAKDLKRWIKSKAVRTVSIYGIPKLEHAAGETRVVDFQPLSIDWTPLGRAGMNTRVVAVGEMDTIITKGGDDRMDVKEVLEMIKQALKDGSITAKSVIGEIGISTAEALEALGLTDYDSTKKIAGEIAQALNVEADKAIEEVKKLKEAAEKYARLEHEQKVDKVIAEMVQEGEEARKVIRRFLEGKVEVGASEEDIKKAVGELMEHDDVVKQVLKAFYNEPYLQTRLARDTQPGLVVKKVRI